MNIVQYLRDHISSVSVAGQQERLYPESAVVVEFQRIFNEKRLRLFEQFCHGFPNEPRVTLLEDAIEEE